jgi:chemotaxis protein MotB
MAGGKSGGAWKVAYADFVTAMMAFFLVMWIVGQDEPVKLAVAKYFEDPIGMDQGSRSTSMSGPDDSTTIGAFESGRGPSRGLAMAENRTVGRRNMAGTAARKPPHVVIFRPFNRTYSVGTVIVFAQDSAALDEAAKEKLDALAPLLLGKPNKVEIRVYSPRRDRPTGARFAEGWDVARARCLAVMEHLSQHGIDPKRIRLSQEGELEPDTLYTDDGKAVPGSRVEVFGLDEWVDMGRNAMPASAPAEASNPSPPAEPPTPAKTPGKSEQK